MSHVWKCVALCLLMQYLSRRAVTIWKLVPNCVKNSGFHLLKWLRNKPSKSVIASQAGFSWKSIILWKWYILCSINQFEKINSFRDIALFEIPYNTVERSSGKRTRSTALTGHCTALWYDYTNQCRSNHRLNWTSNHTRNHNSNATWAAEARTESVADSTTRRIQKQPSKQP